MIRNPAYYLLMLAGAGWGGWWLGQNTEFPDQNPPNGFLERDQFPATAGKPKIASQPPDATRFGNAAADWMHRAMSARATEFPGLLQEMRQIFPGDSHADGKTAAAQRWLMGLWVLADAEGALLFVSDHPEPYGWAGALGDALARVMPGKALEIFAGKGGIDCHPSIKRIMIERLAITDPLGFLMLTISDPLLSNEAISNQALEQQAAEALGNLARSDPEKARELWELNRSNPVFQEEAALYLLMNSLVQNDPSAARAWMESLADDKIRKMARHAWLSAMARTDPMAALREMKNMELGEWDESPRMERIRLGMPTHDGDGRAAVMLSLAKLDRSLALTTLRDLASAHPDVGESRSWWIDQILAASQEPKPLFPDDPDGFWKTLRTTSSGAPDPTWSDALQTALIKEQLHGRTAGFALELARFRAAEWAAGTVSAEAASAPDGSLLALLYHAGEIDPAAMLDVLPEMPARERTAAADQIFDHLSLNETALFGRALPWQSAEVWERRVDSGSEYVSTSPEKLAELAPHFAALEGAAAKPAVTYFSQVWGREDPLSALDWAAGLPPETAPSAMRGLVHSWVQLDDAAASEWVATLPAGPTRDSAATGLVKGLYRHDLPSALAWVENISDRAAGTLLLEEIARSSVTHRTPDAPVLLQDALDRMEATPEQRQAVQSALQPDPALTLPPGDPFAAGGN